VTIPIPEVSSRNRLLAFLEDHFAITGSGGGGGGDVSVSGTPSNNQVPTWTNSTTIQGESNLTFDGSTLTVTGDTSITGDTTLGNASGDTVTINAATINPVNIAAGTDNSVVVYNGSSLVTDEIDSRVWGSTLVDASSGASTQLAVFSDSNTIAGSAELTYDGSTFLLTDAAAKLQVLDTTLNYAITLLPGSGPKLQFGDTDSSDGSFMTIGAYGGINNIDTEGRDFHLFGTNTTTGLYFDESEGTFGIGTTTPQVELHVCDSNGAPQIRLSDTDASIDQQVVAYIEYYRGSNTNRIGWCGYGSSTTQDFTVTNQTATGSFEVKTNNTTAFTVDYQGNADVVGDLTVTGGDIKDSGGDSRISWSDAGALNLKGAGGTAALQITDSAVSVMSAKPLYVLSDDIRDSSFSSAITFDGGANTIIHGNISGSGKITMAAQPAFSVYANSDQTTVANQWMHLSGNVERFDVGSGYNTTTCQYTAPTTGKYLFTTSVRLDSVNSGAQYVWLRIVTSNATFYGDLWTYDQDRTGFATPSLTVVADMTAGDTADVNFKVFVNTANSETLDAGYCTFMGYLLG
tara:strand:+ start:4721 stop:6442 length:1722 start_codon:yes stop_codon:yes gene_type:complete